MLEGATMKNLKEVVEKNLDKLILYVPIVARVHGGTHPEFHKVKSVFDQMLPKMQNLEAQTPELDSEFEELRRITDHYEVPTDVCESYEAVYQMLEELDQAYTK
jgi:iron-sulfur cluster repair protein YtfE (RIC family)